MYFTNFNIFLTSTLLSWPYFPNTVSTISIKLYAWCRILRRRYLNFNKQSFWVFCWPHVCLLQLYVCLCTTNVPTFDRYRKPEKQTVFACSCSYNCNRMNDGDFGSYGGNNLMKQLVLAHIGLTFFIWAMFFFVLSSFQSVRGLCGIVFIALVQAMRVGRSSGMVCAAECPEHVNAFICYELLPVFCLHKKSLLFCFNQILRFWALALCHIYEFHSEFV